jgi:hypothetical protein
MVHPPAQPPRAPSQAEAVAARSRRPSGDRSLVVGVVSWSFGVGAEAVVVSAEELAVVLAGEAAL